MGNMVIYGKYMGNIWEIYGKYMGNLWERYGKYMGNIWEIYGTYDDLVINLSIIQGGAPPVMFVSL